MAKAAPDLALYVGPAGCALGNGNLLVPHETVCVVPRAEAESSDLWKPLDKAPKGVEPEPRLTAADNGEPEKN